MAVVFADRAAYLKYSRGELDGAAESIIAYFSLDTNRMTMYDLTGTERGGRGNRGGSAAQINQVLARPEAQMTVATIIHEATHQIAFNSGLHARLSDCPMWFSEGIAVYFETLDLRSAKGEGIGEINRPRLALFRQYLRRRPRDSLATLIRTNKRFNDSEQAADAYAEAWALTYFLMKQRPQQYIDYLKLLSPKKPLIEDPPEERVRQFEQCFGSLQQLDGELLRYMARVR